MGNKHKSTVKPKKKDRGGGAVSGAEIAYSIRKALRSYFPGFRETLAGVPDTRRRKDYRADELLLAAAGMFIFKAQSRNALNNDRRHSSGFAANFEKLFGASLPHLDAVQAFFKTLPPAGLEKIKTGMAGRLVENKVFYKHKILGHYMVAVDATGVISSEEDRFGCGLKKESKNGKTTYLYPVLEAKLVTESGFCISLATEWITNDNNKPYDKQDCEQKAFKRLAENLKKAFPRLPICILADALYAASPVMGICEGNGWKYIITLKDGSLPALQDCLRDDPPTHRNSFVHQTAAVAGQSKNIDIKQEFYWVEDLLHKKHTLHYIQCKETATNAKTNKAVTQNFVRITNFTVGKDTIKPLSKAGRCRWKIENEGFNEEKNNGYNMAHLYSRKSFNALQNYYQCMLIAHLINQLVEHTNAIQGLLAAFNKLTIKYLWQQLSATMKCGQLCKDVLESIDNKKHQVRLWAG